MHTGLILFGLAGYFNFTGTNADAKKQDQSKNNPSESENLIRKRRMLEEIECEEEKKQDLLAEDIPYDDFRILRSALLQRIQAQEDFQDQLEELYKKDKKEKFPEQKLYEITQARAKRLAEIQKMEASQKAHATKAYQEKQSKLRYLLERYETIKLDPAKIEEEVDAENAEERKKRKAHGLNWKPEWQKYVKRKGEMSTPYRNTVR